MARIKKVIGMTNHGDWAAVEVLMEDGEIAEVYIGGDCEVFLHRNKIKAFVKKVKSV